MTENNNNNNNNSDICRLESAVSVRKQQLLELLSYYHYMQNSVLPHLMFLYESYFSDIEIEIEQKSRVALELERKAELLSKRLRKGEVLNDNAIHFINTYVHKELEFNSKLSNLRKRSINTNEDADYSISFNASDKGKEELPKVYRQIVKKLHPDVSSDTENFNKYWDCVQYAYKNGNLCHLKLFQKALFSDSSALEDKASFQYQKLQSELEELELNIEYEKKRIKKLTNQEPFVYENLLNDNLWVARRKRRLREKLFQIERRINFHKRMLRALTGREYNQIMEHAAS
jgi:hypothetical protein